MESVSRTIKKLMIKEPFYGIFASGITRSWSTQVDHAGIVPDGLIYKLLINKQYWESLDEDHRLGLIKHNLLHMCFFHITDKELYRTMARNEEVLNMAMNLEANSYIYDEWCPNDGSAEIFKILPNLPKCQGTKFYISVLNDIISGKNNDIVAGTDTSGVVEILQHTQRDHDTWDSANGQFIGIRRTHMEYYMRTVAETARAQNAIPDELTNIIGGLFTFKKPIFNWKKFFRQFLANACDFNKKPTRRKESNRFEGAVGSKNAKKHSILVGVDTSGSISQKDLDAFFSEIYHVWKTGADVEIIEFDWVIQQHYKYKGKTPDSVKGRGGTSFQQFTDYYRQNRRKYSVGICFTDGYASLNQINPGPNFCWVITPEGDHDQKYPGYSIHIPKIIE